jgi:pimeloyl-ACP methyl ester carboxylesterase
VKILLFIILFPTFLNAWGKDNQVKGKKWYSSQWSFTIPTPDKYPIGCDFSYTMPSSKQTVILLHQLGKDRFSWGKFTIQLANAGFNRLWFDARGHGFSVKGQKVIENGKATILDDAGSWKYFAPTGENNEWNKMTDDLGLIIENLKKNKDLANVFDPKQVILVGADIGANTALKYAAKNKEIKAIVLLSPGLNYYDIKTELPANEWDGRPCLIVCARGDKESYEASKQLKALMDKSAPDDKTKIKLEMVEGNAHGTDMLGGELDKKILNWIRETMKN